ncbi:type I 3-dehydroquinate dehydratase [Lactiplantibacillus plantarum]|uniref:type I 3-dehydroquinate dehydratase n=1 Tax=Lactiplantibacillus plantarum TaxID=1590 RepID=UPI002800BFB4|nr:type I 3-dehydroquinate dehydratase [Lactiplantibacillus plantarum]MDQ7896821.1 type I 3-dehydroquinate dehydratase [Lactiplantibacillus plantarum]
MQPAIKLRNIELGSGRPKLAVPITGTTINDILAATTPILAAHPDVVEWRIDFFKDVINPEKLKSAGQQLRQALGDIALLTTFRTKGEGGELALSDTEYFKLCETVLDGGFTDALDVERYHDEQAVKQIVAAAHEHQVVVIMSNHDFDKTLAVAEIVKHLTSMVDYGADVAKMAVMPQSVEDVLTLLTATNIARQTLPQPVITMSMGDLGKVSRLAGEVFGSCLSFATVGAASAPGQIALENLRPELEDLKLN